MIAGTIAGLVMTQNPWYLLGLPLIVLIITVLFLGEITSSGQVMGAAIIAIGIISLAFVQNQNADYDLRAVAAALTTGAFIAGYSLVDGLGARAGGTALGYWIWASIGNSLAYCLWAAFFKRDLFAKFFTSKRAIGASHRRASPARISASPR